MRDVYLLRENKIDTYDDFISLNHGLRFLGEYLAGFIKPEMTAMLIQYLREGAKNRL